MSENVIAGATPAPSFARPRAFDTIVYGGLAIGILDMLFAFTFYSDTGHQRTANLSGSRCGIDREDAGLRRWSQDFRARSSPSLCCSRLHSYCLLPG